jgi:beta-glucosidase/6-phospho-beta-glucosidase/beta-galactosidase
LGKGFAIGVATSGYQIEGGYNAPGQPANNWAGWERSGRVARSGVACDFWAHPEEALDRAVAIGCTTFRLSVEWARLEPEAGRFDEGALTRYVEILEMCGSRRLEPMITLHHFTHPAWLGEEFWLRPGSPDIFARHVQRVVPALAPHCHRWATVNEPNILMLMGWITGGFPPGRRYAIADAFCVLDNLLAAHVLASDAIVAEQPDAQVACNTSSSSLYESDRLVTDLLLLRTAGIPPSDVDRYVDERRALHDAVFTPQHAGEFALRRAYAALSPYGTNRGAGGGPLWARLRATTRRPLPRRVVDVVYASPQERSVGAVGFNWYDPVASHAVRLPGRRLPDGGRSWTVNRAIWDTPADPAGLAAWCRTESALYPGLPLWVLENGMATRVEGGRAVPRQDGWDRPRFIREHFAALADAVAEGSPVTAYLHWSLVDNYEWGSYEPRFGIFGMDRSDPSGAVRWLDTDAAGDDAAGAFTHAVRALAAGDRAELGGGPA